MLIIGITLYLYICRAISLREIHTASALCPSGIRASNAPVIERGATKRLFQRSHKESIDIGPFGDFFASQTTSLVSGVLLNTKENGRL